MNVPSDGTSRRGLGEWWANPPRSGMQRVIFPWEYRHVRAFGIARIVGGLVGMIAGLVCLAYAAYGWAAFFLAVGTLSLAFGYWYLTIARSQSPRA